MASNIPKLIRQYIKEGLGGVYTISMVVVENVDMDAMRCEVSLKRDQDLLIDDVPIASPFARADGHGLVVPITPGETEGFVLHTKEPLEDLTVDAGHQEIDTQRQFSPMDAVFFPAIWNDNDTTPTESFTDYKEGDYLVSHQSGTFIHIKGDEHANPGTTTIETPSGQKIVLDESAEEINIASTSVVIGDSASSKPILTEDAKFDYEDTQPDGSTTTKTTTKVSNGESTSNSELS